MWHPEGDAGPALRIEAFGEGDSPLAIPSPLIRVPEGTEIAASIDNGLVNPMRVHGLCDRSADACPPIDLAPGETRSVRFRSGPVGTYHYWATTTGMPLPFRAADDTQLSGAFIVDAAGARPDADRVFVITDWTALTRQQLAALVTLDDPGAAFLAQKTEVKLLVNGRSWPHTERLSYDLAEPVRWRLVNLSTQTHPMHLHGFHYEVDSLGDGRRDQAFPAGRKPVVVTQVMQPGSTMGMTWVPQRPGNWLFHCHLMTHVSPSLHVDGSARPGGAHGAAHHEGAGMTGLVLGVTVRGHEEQTSGGDETTPWTTRGIRLVMESQAGRFGDAPAYGFALDGERDPRSGGVPVPGPTLVLRRGERVEITLVNRLPEATAIHWHGMELDSYYDGVHGWSGQGSRLSPLVEPGGSFVVRFTPPRAGTFMYHTHLHERRQLTSGLYGAMLVLRPRRDLRRGDGPCVRHRPWRATARCARGDQRPGQSDRPLEGRRASPRALRQHHAGRQRLHHAADVRRSGRRGGSWRRTGRRCRRISASPVRPVNPSASGRPSTSSTTHHRDGGPCGSTCEVQPANGWPRGGSS